MSGKSKAYRVYCSDPHCDFDEVFYGSNDEEEVFKTAKWRHDEVGGYEADEPPEDEDKKLSDLADSGWTMCSGELVIAEDS